MEWQSVILLIVAVIAAVLVGRVFRKSGGLGGG